MIGERTYTEALALTQAWCAIPSVRGNETGMRHQADVIVDWLSTNLNAELVARTAAGGKAELLHARIDVGAPRTVILYNMYDVMPATPNGWSVDPFRGGIVDLESIGPSFVARGAENNKGPLAGMLCVLKALVECNRLGVNVEVLLDGEEENSSGAMRTFLGSPDCGLRPSAAAIFPSFCEYGGGAPRLYMGFSGIARGELRVDGGDWGGPEVAIHSSNAPWIANPASRLVQALALIGTPPTGQLGQIALDEEAKQIVDTLARTFEPEAELRFRHTKCFYREDDAAGLLEHVLTTASFNLSRLRTYPEDATGVIPYCAVAGFELRSPPGLDPAVFLARVEQSLNAMPGARLVVEDTYPGIRFRPDAPCVSAIMRAYERTAVGAPQIWPWAIGCAPGYAFAPHAPSFLLAGAGRGGNAHGTDEFMTLEGYRRFLASIALWLEFMAEDPLEACS